MYSTNIRTVVYRELGDEAEADRMPYAIIYVDIKFLFLTKREESGITLIIITRSINLRAITQWAIRICIR